MRAGALGLIAVLVGVSACTAGTASAPGADSSTARPPASYGTRPVVGPEGFDLWGMRVTPAGDPGSPEPEVCVWAALTPAQRARGLMGVTDLGGAAGMVFVYAEDRSTNFTMRNTLIDLSIAFFDAGGRFMEAFDMEPCGQEPCPDYPTPAGFRVALEVPEGELGRWGIGPGSTVALTDRCDTASS